MRELKPCPFCGGEVHMRREWRFGDDEYRIHCDECDLTMVDCDLYDLRDRWDARAAGAEADE